jgi:aryl-alcohol dehydrogenase-like predicted oxidoreductase
MERQKKMARRFVNDRTLMATARIMEIATEAGISPVTLAVAWSKQHDFVASTIIGVSHIDQLEDCLKAADVILDDAVMENLEALEVEIPNPMTEDGLRKL